MTQAILNLQQISSTYGISIHCISIFICLFITASKSWTHNISNNSKVIKVVAIHPKISYSMAGNAGPLTVLYISVRLGCFFGVQKIYVLAKCNPNDGVLEASSSNLCI